MLNESGTYGVECCKEVANGRNVGVTRLFVNVWEKNERTSIMAVLVDYHRALLSIRRKREY